MLKTGVTLYLDQDVTLLGSPNKDDYLDTFHCTAIRFSSDKTSFLIYADQADHFGIAGPGTIDGNGETFWDSSKRIHHFQSHWAPKGWRPCLVGFARSHHITLKDFHAKNSPQFTFLPHHCTDITIDGVKIDNPQYGPNADGIDLDCCRRVTIANCNIRAGDDAIALKSNSSVFGDEELPCEDITVTNCILSGGAASSGVRLGGFEGDSPIRNCTFSNLVIYDSALGIDLGCAFADIAWLKKGIRIENVVFQNITMRNVGNPIHLWMANWKKDQPPMRASIRNVQISNVIAECHRGCFITGLPGLRVENVTLSDIHLTIIGKMEENAPELQDPFWFGLSPYAFYCSQADNVRVRNLSVDWSRSQGVWPYTAFVHDSGRVIIDTLTEWGREGTPAKATFFAHASDLTLRHIAPSTKTPLVHSQGGAAVRQYDCGEK